jgi:hypothetical protein
MEHDTHAHLAPDPQHLVRVDDAIDVLEAAGRAPRLSLAVAAVK